MNSLLETSNDCDTPGRFFNRKAKKYAIKQMITHSQKECTQKHLTFNSKKLELKKSQYFQNMIKQQNKKMFINTFIKKLKRVIVRQDSPEHQCLYLHEKNHKYVNGLSIPPAFQLFFSVFSILEISFLLIVISLSLVFDSVHKSQLYIATLAIGFTFQIMDIVKSIVSVKTQDGKKFDKLDDILGIYLQSQGISDFLLIVAYIIEFFFYTTFITQITRYIFIFKIIPLLKRLDYFQHSIIQNIYWKQVWELVKLFLINYIYAHFLSLILISMTHLNQQQNWMHLKQIGQKNPYDQYVWAYYWATTIMLTVGFGDIAPVNTSEALCMIFIQTISCILLAYNINNVGVIVSNIRSYSVLQQTNMKTFRNLTSTNVIPSELTNRIANYIKQSIQMKKKSNIDQQNKFVQSLPNSFREDLLKECNRKVFSQLLFFKNLSDKIIIQLSIRIERKLTHPQQVIHRRKDPTDVIIFNSGQVAYTYFRNSNRALYSNCKVVQKYLIGQNQFKMLSLDFLFNSFFSFNVKCLDYTIVYKMSKQGLIDVLKDNPYDYEYFCMMKDKDKLLLNEFQIQKCQLCLQQKHYLDKCPRLHYIPLHQHVLNKFLNNNISQFLMVRLKNPRISKTQYKTFLDKKVIWEDLLRKRIEQRDQLNKTIIRNTVLYQPEETNEQNIFRYSSQVISDGYYSQIYNQHQSLYFEAAQKLKDEMSKVLYLQQNKQRMWDIEIDLIQDFKYYFKKFNPQKINISLGKKDKRRKRRTKTNAFRPIF